ncbi:MULTISPECIES: hypothetical protein [Phyllobacteriaceae]|uniref:hypothetical protein n=1 Tax=Phyllobacteriaceae TaxID=69277 RepID=UPI002ACA2E58|nr:hypothetical protein [Chelativorans sp. M5D2P16]MDZ5695743.1 hypothetical protein [Chelativorans sp. M5D2P16]
MLDRIIALVALAALTLYLGIFVVSVPRPALIVVTAVVLALVYFDFWNQLFRNRK